MATSFHVRASAFALFLVPLTLLHFFVPFLVLMSASNINFVDDSTRVVLAREGEESSDYINANWVNVSSFFALFCNRAVFDTNLILIRRVQLGNVRTSLRRYTNFSPIIFYFYSFCG